MLKSWPFALAVVVVGGLAGVAIAGRPEPGDPFVLDPSITIAESTPSTSVIAPTTSTSATSTSQPVITTTIAATSTEPASTVAPTEAPTTTEPLPTTEPPTTATIPGPLPRNQVRLVIANGDGRFRLANITADRIRPLGYIIDLGDTLKPVAETVIYYRPGFDDEAAYAATDIGVPDALILAFPTNASQPITNSDAAGDVIIVLGPDAPR